MFMAENLTISIPGSDCNKMCPYCVSKMTPSIKHNPELWRRNLEKAYHIAEIAHVTSVLLTSKGEPTLNYEDIMYASKLFKKFPLELQTNGIIFRNYMTDECKRFVHDLYINGFDTISLSIDFINNDLEKELENFAEFLKYNNEHYDMNIRLALNYTNHVPIEYTEPAFVATVCKKFGIKQVIIRNIVPPTNVDHKNARYKWIMEHTNQSKYYIFIDNFKKYVNKTLIRETAFGMSIYDVYGISFACSTYCIQDTNKSTNIRSLIYQADGHLYTSWNSMASILF